VARKIVIDNSNGEVRAAVIEDGKLADLFIERSRHPSVLGNIYKGRVENVLPGMQASFVDIGLEKNAFLYVDDAMASLPEIVKATKNGDDVELPISRGKSIKELLKTGQDVLVQVTKEPIGTKGARVVTDVTLAGRYVVLIPSVNYVGVSRKIVDEGVRDRLRKLANKAKPRGMGIIVRTVAEEQPDEEIVRDIEFLTRAWRKIRAKAARAKAPQMLHYDADLVYRMARDYFGDDVTEFTVNTIGDYNKVSDLLHIDEKEKDPRIRLYSDKKPVFEAYGIEDEIWKATRRKVWLNSGGYLIFDTTEALTVVDVNTGKFTGSKDLEDTAFRNNIEAAGEIARQLRLRNIGGIIIADFIDMESEDHRKRVLEELEKHLEKDKARTSVLGITKLGLIEMTRKKSQQGLVELTHRVCDVCEGRGKVISEETLALRAERLIKREAAATDMQALLIGLNPYVAEELSSQSSKAIKELEEQTYRDIFIKADSSLAREDVKVLAAGSLEEILALVQPVRKGELLEVTIGQPDQDRREYGIATYKGLPVLVEEAGDMVGRTVKVKVTRVFKGYAKARIEGRPSTYRPSADLVDFQDEDEAGTSGGSLDLEHAAQQEAPSGQEAKKKRRRRRHRRSNKDASGPVTDGSVAQDPDDLVDQFHESDGKDMPEIAEERPVKGHPAGEGQPEASSGQEAKKKRRRRRRRSRKPSQQGDATPEAQANAAPASDASQASPAAPMTQAAVAETAPAVGPAQRETAPPAAAAEQRAPEGGRPEGTEASAAPEKKARPRRATSRKKQAPAAVPAEAAGTKPVDEAASTADAAEGKPLTRTDTAKEEGTAAEGAPKKAARRRPQRKTVPKAAQLDMTEE